MSLTRFSSSRNGVSARVSSGGSTHGEHVAADLAPRAEAAAAVRAARRPGRCGRGVTMWTSMSPDSRIVRAAVPGVSRRAHAGASAVAEHELGRVLGAGEGRAAPRGRRRRAPGGSCRPGTRPAAAAAASAPWLAPESPSDRATWTASRSPPLDRAAIRAARRIRVSPSGPPVSATTTRSRASQVPGDVVLLAVVLEGVVDPVGGPEQRELAQGVEVARRGSSCESAASTFSGA